MFILLQCQKCYPFWYGSVSPFESQFSKLVKCSYFCNVFSRCKNFFLLMRSKQNYCTSQSFLIRLQKLYVSCLSVTNCSSQDILLQLFFICQKSVLHKFFLINIYCVQMKRFAFDDFFHFTEMAFKYFYLSSFLFINSLKPCSVSDMSVLCFH